MIANQVAAVAADHSALVEYVVVGAIVGAGKLMDHLKGRGRDHRARESQSHLQSALLGVKNDIRNDIDGVRDAVHALTSEVTAVRHFVVGPDGENGVRGDVRKLETRVEGIEDRERDAKPKPRRRKP